MPDIKREDVSWIYDIEKRDDDLRLVYGWFSVTKEKGVVVIDKQGDKISDDNELRCAFHKFMSDSRSGKVMHKGRRVADVVELIVFTEDVQKALGIDLQRVGAFGCMAVRDDATWERVKSGELRAFSFGGTGIQKEAKP